MDSVERKKRKTFHYNERMRKRANKKRYERIFSRYASIEPKTIKAKRNFYVSELQRRFPTPELQAEYFLREETIIKNSFLGALARKG